MTPAGRPLAQRRVLARLVRRLEPDPRLLVGILVGSLAGGRADALSDVDLVVPPALKACIRRRKHAIRS